MAALPIALLIASTAIAGYSAYSQAQAAKESSEAQKAGIAAQQRAEDARKQSMELDAQRRSREIVRQQQRARAAALTNTTAQGAQFGSALGGGYGQIGGQTGVNLLGVGQNLMIGRDIFAANADVSAARMRMADAASSAATAAGLSTFGGALVKNMGSMSSIFGNFFPAQGNFGGVGSTNTNFNNPTNFNLY